MNLTTKNAIIIVSSFMIAIASVNAIFWVLSVKEPGLITVWSAILAASLANRLTLKYAQAHQASDTSDSR